ncbi:nucleoside monophosphate kinase [Candidatus Saccharibacteria bacterium]|nr:nucleoside monophosphate kinase [Candidatus Saccharibacteria bacterium]
MNEEAEKLRHWLGTGSINIFGRPFSGKDTQSKNLSTIFQAPIIGGGDIIRSSTDDQQIQEIIDKGNLAPQQDYLKLVIPYLSNEEYNGKPLILNSLGRWHGEEEPIMSAAHLTRHPVKAVINLEISEEDVWKRWEAAKHRKDRGFRNDDNDLSIKNRLAEFQNKTVPVIEYYNEKGILITVNGTQAEDDVSKKILTQLLQKLEH